jgi:CRISPR-associated protein Csx17
MKGSRVPWITTGHYVNGNTEGQTKYDDTRSNATLLNLALIPLDESQFLDQFDLVWSHNKVDSRSPHSERTKINEAMETAALEPTPNNCIMLLESIFHACHRMCVSEAFRKNLRSGRASFFAPLPMEEWNSLLSPLESQPEFRIARALASIMGLLQLNNGNRSGVLPMLGSLLPLTIGRSRWSLPDSGERTHQNVWTGEDLAHGLTAVLRRRYLDSLNDDFPSLRAVHGAQLDDVFKFLSGELDDCLISRWTEAMSLIGWSFPKSRTDDVHNSPDDTNDKEAFTSIEPVRLPAGSWVAYAALRTLLELECEWQGEDRRQWKKRRSQQPFVLLCERSASSLPYAVSEALRWINIWGVRNPWGTVARLEKPRISGQYVVRLDGNSSSAIYDQQLADRLAAAVCIPLRWQDRQQLYRAVTLPPGA